MPLRGAGRSSKRSKRAEIDPELSGKESDQLSMDGDCDPLDRIAKKVQSPPVPRLTTKIMSAEDNTEGQQSQDEGAKALSPGPASPRTQDHDPSAQGVLGATAKESAEPCTTHPLIELESNAESILTENLLHLSARKPQIGKVSTDMDELDNLESRSGDRLLVRELRSGISDSRLAQNLDLRPFPYESRYQRGNGSMFRSQSVDPSFNVRKPLDLIGKGRISPQGGDCREKTFTVCDEPGKKKDKNPLVGSIFEALATTADQIKQTNINIQQTTMVVKQNQQQAKAEFQHINADMQEVHAGMREVQAAMAQIACSVKQLQYETFAPAKETMISESKDSRKSAGRPKSTGLTRIPRSRSLVESSSSDSERSDQIEDQDSLLSSATDRARSARSQNLRNVKLPVFSGKDSWKVWINRFEEIARRQGWTEEDKLDEMLPKLQGVAGEFVYGQMSRRERSNYANLVHELNSRFRVVETSKTYEVQFSNRDQNPGEKPEEYSAELKRLYTKAYKKRGADTRREDLLRRFLNGLLDTKARFHIECIKSPKDIDEAVNELVNYTETRKCIKSRDQIFDRKPKKAVRMVRPSPSDSEDEDDEPICEEEVRAVRVYGKTNSQTQEKGVKPQVAMNKSAQDMSKPVVKVNQPMAKQEPVHQVEQNKPYQFKNQGQKGPCFRCHNMGHFARECPEKRFYGYQPNMNQMPMDGRPHQVSPMAPGSYPGSYPHGPRYPMNYMNSNDVRQSNMGAGMSQIGASSGQTPGIVGTNQPTNRSN